MNSKFEWFGFSVARKHVYFYTALIAATLVANTVKDQFIGHRQPDPAFSQLHKLKEQMAEFEANH
jgi:hypothetical protein